MKKVAFVGNPNVGKTALINGLSGSNFKVGNWPGVTIEKKEAVIQLGEETYYLVDLPGVYSFDKLGNEERITRDYLIDEEIDLVINVLDSTNLERNLYLTMLLREMHKDMIVVLNFDDELKKLGYEIDEVKLSKYLGIQVIKTSAMDKTGFKALEEAIKNYQTPSRPYKIYYNQEIETLFNLIYPTLDPSLGLLRSYYTMRIIEKRSLISRFQESYQIASKQIEDLEEKYQDKSKHIVQYARYHYINKIVSKVLQKSDHERLEKTRKIDNVILHKWLGLPLFALTSVLLLSIVFNGSAPFMDWLEGFIGEFIAKYTGFLLRSAPDWMYSLVIQGIIGGVGGVLVFTPLMFVLYMFLSILEESGYMSRVSFLLDRGMRTVGLNGKSVIPMLLGFGCSVPAIYASRTLDNPVERKKTALMIPFMSCGARLPIYGLFAGALFGTKMGVIIAFMYLIGIVLALVVVGFFGTMLTKTDKAKPMLIELPPYRLPKFSFVVKKAWQEVRMYLKKVTGIIFVVLVVLWGLTYFPTGKTSESYMAQFGKTAAPIFKPLGFGEHWQLVASIPGSIAAKETAVGFLSQVLHEESEEEVTYDFMNDLTDQGVSLVVAFKDSALNIISFNGMFGDTDVENSQGMFSQIQELFGQDAHGQLVAFSYMVFMLLVVPCVAALAAIKQEFGKKFMFQVIVLMLVVPYFVSLVVYQVGSLVI